ncbi:MAG: hypothetical protein V3U92_01100 [Cellulophaga sp.]
MKTLIQTPTSNLTKSLSFYLKLGFTLLSKENPVIVSDGKAILEINPDNYARAGIKLLNKDWGTTVEKLNVLTTVLKTPSGYLLNDTNGVWIYLIEAEKEFHYTQNKTSSSVLGNFAGISIESIGIEKSKQLWEILGFKKTMGAVEQGWISLTNEDHFTISLMKANSCPHLFFNPSLTYFNGKNNVTIIKNIRKLNIPIIEEITHFNPKGEVDNISIKDPGGLGCFLFSD